MSRPHVLLVEDSTFLSQKVTDQLADQYSFYTSSAETAAVARDVIATSDIDCILVKHNLPDESGLEFAESLTSDIPVILVTSTALEEVAMEAIRAGVSEFFQKDNLAGETMDVLANRIQILVDLHTLRN